MKRTKLTADDLEAMRACASREVAMRKTVYPKHIDAGKMTEEKASEEVRLMEGITHLLGELRDEAAGVREFDF